jgi:serine/threonine protein kinase
MCCLPFAAAHREPVVPLTDDELGGLNSEQWRDLRDCASRLEKVLQSGAAFVDLQGFLPPPDAPHRRAVLHELIKTELEARYSRGQGCLLEEFLERHPELGGPEDLPASLLYEEYHVRCRFGECPAADEYRVRFPAQFAQFQQLVQEHSSAVPPTKPAPASSYGTLSPVRTQFFEPASPRTVSDPPRPPSAPTASDAPRPPSSRTGSDAPNASSPPKTPGRGASPQLVGGEGYQLLERIGQGQFGEVHRALAPGGVVVAVKRIFRALDDESCQRELKALRTIRELRHPFLLQIHNYQAFDDRLLIVMELADGSLEDRLKECRAKGLPGIPAGELLRYFTEAAEALDFLHQQKLSHRDIKPQNMLHLKGHAKVADLGIARSQENAMEHTLNVGGTPVYMAPEMWDGNISVHSDQYSFALTWYEMRTGRRVFSGTTARDIFQHHLSGKLDVSGVPEAEQKVLLRALARQPDQRFPTCAAFVQALAETLAPAKPQIPARGRGTPIRVGLLVFALMAVPLAALAVLFWLRPQPKDDSKPQQPVVSWLPKPWEPVDKNDIVEDRRGQRYYRRLVQVRGGQEIVMEVVPEKIPNDRPTFYIMENKVWNDLYAVFMADPKGQHILQKYSSCPECDSLVRGEWEKGAYAPILDRDVGVGPDKGRLPVFRVTVTEAHCFAEWLNEAYGRLPTRQQWRKAAGLGEDTRPGPFSPGHPDGFAVRLGDGPWPVDRGEYDVSIHGCRQMASNGCEWTRELADDRPGEKREIPLDELKLAREVFIEGQSYTSLGPLTFQAMAAEPRVKKCTEASPDVSFRVVLERPLD